MMIFTSIYGVVDVIFVSNVVGSGAFTSVNLVMPAVVIISTFGFMIGAGGSAVVSKTLGEGDKTNANRYFSMLIYFEIIVGIISTVLGLFTLKPILHLVGATEDLVGNCLNYGRILLLGIPFFILQSSLHSFLIVANKPNFGLIISIVSGLINISLDALIVWLLNLGVAGAAAATVISEAVGAVIPLIYFIFKSDSITLVKTKIEKTPIIKACTNGSSEMVTNISMSLVNVLYNIQLLKYAGADGICAYGIIMYVSFLFSGTFIGYSIGSAPIISYNYGAQRTDELKSLLNKSIRILAVASITMTALAEIFANQMASIFVGYDENLQLLTANAIRLFSISYLLSWLNAFSSSFFTALNNGLVSALISFSRTFLFQLTMILVLPLVFKLNGIWLSEFSAEFLTAFLSIITILANKIKYNY